MNHLKLLLCFLLSLMAQSVTATLHYESTSKTKPIRGFAPFMQSMGSQMAVEDGYVFDRNNFPVTAVTDLVYIPSFLCGLNESQIANHELKPFFNFQDQDSDRCDTLNAGNLNWYILDAKGRNWDNITAWEQLTATAITNASFPGSILPPGSIQNSQYTSVLKIPEAAAGKRIGFIYTPYARTGYPSAGQAIKVWDLDYFFGQTPYLSAGNPEHANEGLKLNKINAPSGGGDVTHFMPPIIDNLRMQGIFALNQTLEANYTLIPNTSGSYTDVSRFWWGKQGTTKALANFSNPSFTTSKKSPILSESDIGSIYEVTVLPIREESGFYIVGSPVSVLSNDPKNEFPSAPSIKNLAFTDDLFLLKPISATYEFDNGGAAGVTDQSRYTWSYRTVLNQLVRLSGGTITTSGQVPNSPTIWHTTAGRMIELKVEPIDNLSRMGTPVTITGLVEDLESVSVMPKSLTFDIADTNPQSLTAEGYYSKGTVTDISNLGTWRPSDLDINVSNLGVVTIDPANTMPKTGTVTFTYDDKSDTADIIIQSAMSLELEVIQNNAIATEESNSIRAIVRDGQGAPMANTRVDFSTSTSNITLSPMTTLTNSQGIATVSVNKTSSGNAQAVITAKLSGTATTHSVTVDFLGLREVNRVVAPQNYNFSPYQKFPTTGFDNASFTIIADNSVPNTALTWSSSEPNSASVNGEGLVTLNESSLRKTIKITAKNDTTAYRYEFRIDKWFMAPKFYKFDNAFNYCTSIGAVIPPRMQLSQGKGVRGIGSLWSEWHKPPTWQQGLDTQYWSSTESAFKRVYVIDIYTGDNTMIKANDGAYSEYTSCMKQ